MINRVVPRDRLAQEVTEMAEKIAAMPRLGLALTKKAVNQAEDAMGLQVGMDSVFGLHHLAHAHNAETATDSLAGHDARSMRDARHPDERAVTGVPRERRAVPRRGARVADDAAGVGRVRLPRRQGRHRPRARVRRRAHGLGAAPRRGRLDRPRLARGATAGAACRGPGRSSSTRSTRGRTPRGASVTSASSWSGRRC